MAEMEKVLDDEARRLYKLLHGIDESYGQDFLAEGLEKQKEREDEKRTLIIGLAHLLSAYLMDANIAGNPAIENDTFQQVLRTMDRIWKLSGKKLALLIRYRGFPNDPKVSEKDDYEMIYGTTTVDAAVVEDMIKRLGHRVAHFSDQLNRAFKVFSSFEIYSLYLRFPKNIEKQLRRLHDALRAITQYKKAVTEKSPIILDRDKGGTRSYPVILDSDGSPDENLTLLTIANEIKPQITQKLVEKIGASPLKDRYMSIYNAIFAVQKIKGRLVRPPIEINNVVWLMGEHEVEAMSQEQAEVAQFAIKSVGGSPVKAARILKSVYGNDYEKIDSKGLNERLQLSSDLLVSVDKAPAKSKEMRKEIIGSIEKRLDQVKEQVFDDLFTQSQADLSGEEPKFGFLGSLHKKVLSVVTFCKRRNDTKKKMRKIVDHDSKLNTTDFQTIAKDFGISVQEAHALIEMLEGCFDDSGHFVKAAFAHIIPEFSRFERKIFEFLWRYMREYVHDKDRIAFLNSLQLLINRMQKPKLIVKILLSDFYQDPEIISYSDSKALMLSSLLVRKRAEMVDMEITPEDIIKVSEGLDQSIAGYMAWRISKDQDKFFEKIKTIHQTLIETLNPEKKQKASIPAQYLLQLERETYIFLALIGGITARSVILSALKDYSDPSSTIYNSKESERHLNALFGNLRIVIRALARVGEVEDLHLVDDFKNKIHDLADKGKSDQCELLLKRIQLRAEESKMAICQRHEKTQPETDAD
jgi:hypothetical protein